MLRLPRDCATTQGRPRLGLSGLLLTLVVSAFGLAGCEDDPEPTKKPDATTDASNPQDSNTGSDTTASEDTTTAGDTTAPAGALVNRSLRWDGDLRGLGGSTANDLWIAGKGGLLLHWNGRTLAPVDSGTTADLYAVTALSASDAIAVGEGVILQWDGQTWQDRTPANKPSLRAVHGSDGTVLAAGLAGQVWRRGPGGSAGQWTADTTPTAFDLFAIRVTGTGQAWALGNQGQALKLSGGSWQVTAVPKASGALRAITAAPSGKLFAAGDDGFLAATQNAVWNATLANDPQSRTLRGLFARSDTDAWAIGDSGALLHLTAGKWQLEQIAGTYNKTRSFHAMWGEPGATAADEPFALAIGDGGAGVQLQAGEWQDFRVEVSANLNQVAAASDGALVACGDGGLLLRAESATAPMYDLAAPVTAADLLDCASNNLGVLATGGVNGASAPGATDGSPVLALWSQAAGWEITSGSALGAGLLGGVTGVAPLAKGWLAVGAGGGAVRWTAGTGWEAELTANQIPLSSIAVDADGLAFAVGQFGTVLRRALDGQWQREQLPGGDAVDLYRVIAWGSGEAMAVGDAGTIYVRSASGVWNKVYESPANRLYGAVRKADGTLLAVGWAGTVIAGKSGGFAKVPTNQPAVLRGVAEVPSGTVAVGWKGAVYRIVEPAQ